MVDKSKLRLIYGGVMATTFTLYTTLGVTLALYYGTSIEQACTLNWANYRGGAAAGETVWRYCKGREGCDGGEVRVDGSWCGCGCGVR